MDDSTPESFAAPLDAPERSATEGAPVHAPAAVQTLKDAMRRARADDAERAGVLADLRAARIGRLEILQEALQPLIAQVPKDVDFFDVALMPGASPRLFIDMIGFVEMGRDSRTYNFLQDTRHGRVKLAESAQIDTMVRAVTDYVARRLLERDKALAADANSVTPRGAATQPATASDVLPSMAIEPAAPRARRRGKALIWFKIAFMFLIETLGAIAFFAILAGLAFVLWKWYGHA